MEIDGDENVGEQRPSEHTVQTAVDDAATMAPGLS